jgi:hypothetical protein
MDISGEGPLSPGDIGEVLEDDMSSKPYKVIARTGASKSREWWYHEAALSSKVDEKKLKANEKVPKKR